MKAKKILSMILVGAAAVSLLAGCSSGTDNTQDDTAEGAGNVLIVYYSATGNTKGVANSIADITGGDLFALELVEPYTDDDLNYNDENSRVSQEYADESLRDVELDSTTVDNCDSLCNFCIIGTWRERPASGGSGRNRRLAGRTEIPFWSG